MKVLIPTLGSHGDVLPFLAMGQELARRGHEVVLSGPAPFARHAARAGLSFHPLGTESEFEAMFARPDLYRFYGGVKFVFELAMRAADETVRWLEGNLGAGANVIVAPPQSYGARIMQERFDLPTATVHLTPLNIESRIASPRLPGLPVPAFLPGRLRHRLSRGGDQYLIDRLALPPLNAYRAGFGLPPARRLRHWWNSPHRLILTFPDWYASPQLDWPQQAVQVGFPFADRLGNESELTPALAAFLDEGAEPLVFIYGSWMRESHRFFSVAARTCERMRRRGILLSPQADQVPRTLPVGVVHVPYAPLSRLLMRCAALVHHGGVGTTALALAAGVPQVVVPIMGDHFDAGERVRRMGVGTVLSRRTLTSGRVARALSRLLADPDVTRACASSRARIEREDGVARACDTIEAMG